MMEITAAIIPLFFTPCICQFVMDFGMKPDVTFGEENERFDVASIIQDQSRMDVANPIDDYRRQGKRNEDEIEDTRNRGNENNDESKGGKLLDAIKETVGNLDMKDFAYHSNMDSSPDDNDYEKNLKVFGNRRSLYDMVDRLHRGREGSRRGVPPDPDNEILFQHGFPINLKIDGFLEVPLEKR